VNDFSLTAFEGAVLDALLAGDDRHLAVLREQRRVLRVTGRDYSGVGFFLHVEVPDAPMVELRSLRFGDVHAEIDGLEHGAGFLLFVDDGRITMLEGYCYGPGPWPPNETITRYRLRYDPDPRQLVLH
jgi:hypothetical protein